MKIFEPAYLKLFQSGQLEQRVSETHEHLSYCDICAWECHVDRLSGKLGICKTAELVKVSSYGPHFGEERPLSGWLGSGTIFFTRCNLRCQFCQNHTISQSDAGEEIEIVELAAIMLELQSQRCHNINLVSPSHVVPQIIAAVWMATQRGLHLPLVYNTGGYDSLSMLHLLDGIIDIYMPDMKYADARIARHYSKVPNYPKVNQEAVQEMHRQVGELQIDQQGLATRGMLIRHLVLPNNLAGTAEIVQFISTKLSKNTYLNLMDQYRPSYNANQYNSINRPISRQEYQGALKMAHEFGLYRLD